MPKRPALSGVTLAQEAAGRQPLDDFTLLRIAHADERTRLQNALTSRHVQVRYQPHPDGPVYRLFRVDDSFTACFQATDRDPPREGKDPRQNYWPTLFRVDLRLRVPPTDPRWAAWMDQAGLRRHPYFTDLLGE
jgi:hypothetical protein